MEKNLFETTAAEQDSLQPTSENTLPSGECTASEKEPPSGDADRTEFEALIKGRFKEAFHEKVQRIIDGRFKEFKQLSKENKNLQQQLQQVEALPSTAQNSPKNRPEPLTELLLKNGVSPSAAYAAACFESFLNSPSAAQGENAAHLLERLQNRLLRPAENGLNKTTGMAVKKSVSGLSPTQRRELAKKALMGEKIGF